MQGWASVPNGVLAKIFSELKTADCWKCRQLSRTWALQVRQTLAFDVEIITNTSDLVCKVQALFRRQLHERLPCVVFTFYITRPLHLKDLLKVLQALRTQVCVCTGPSEVLHPASKRLNLPVTCRESTCQTSDSRFACLYLPNQRSARQPRMQSK